MIFRHQDLVADLENLKQGTPEYKEVIGKLRKCDPATKRLAPENWENLAECEDDRLKQLGLSKDDVVKHTPWSKADSLAREPRYVEASTSEGASAAESSVGKK